MALVLWVAEVGVLGLGLIVALPFAPRWAMKLFSVFQ